MRRRRPTALVLGLAALLGPAGAATGGEGELAARNAALLERMGDVHRLAPSQLEALRALFARSPFIGQGNPAITRHPMTEARCREILAEQSIDYRDRRSEAICRGPYMAPLYDPAHERPEDAKACIDRFEFPDIPCTYPVVWVRAREAAEICEILGKRLCDAHEWEGACQGALEPPDYPFELARERSEADAVAAMSAFHNRKHAPARRWSYGPEPRKGICAAASQKSPGCQGGGWASCGSNTYPSGSFPGCRSPLGVYDLNGNAAEHMNLPLDPSQMASRGSKTLGVTEMKGSWFIFDHYRAHEDWCRWRAPYWHGSRVMEPRSHHNYHLGFRCCRTLEGRSEPP